MHSSRLAASLLTGSLLLSFAPLAAALTPEDVLQEQEELQESSSCGTNQGKSIGRCVTDTLKRISELRDAWKNALAIEREAWLDAHGRMGVTAAYQEQYNAYLASVAERRKQFQQREQVIRKQAFAVRKTLRAERLAVRQERFSRFMTSTDEEAAATQCNEKQKEAQRICLRLNIRLQSPVRTGIGVVR